MLAFGAQDCTKYKHTFDDFVELCDTIFVSQYSSFIYHHHQSLVSQLNGFGHMNPIYHKEEKDMKERAITIQFLLLSFFLVFFFCFCFFNNLYWFNTQTSDLQSKFGQSIS